MKLSTHFNRKEFTCKCGCGFDTVDSFLLEILENVREHFETPVFITSACRCEKHNTKISGSDKSQHKLGRAADIVVQNFHPDQVYEYLNHRFPDELGLGHYDTFLHIDSRNQKARWRG